MNVVGKRLCPLAGFSESIKFLILEHGISWDGDGILLLRYRIMHVL